MSLDPIMKLVRSNQNERHQLARVEESCESMVRRLQRHFHSLSFCVSNYQLWNMWSTPLHLSAVYAHNE